MMLRTMVSQRGVNTALALTCAVIVRFVPAVDPARPIAGLLLAGPLLAWSIDRLVLTHAERRPALEVRWALAIGFAVVADVALGLILAATPIELNVTSMAIGLLLVVSACELSARPVPREISLGGIVPFSAWVIACVGIGLSVLALVIARNGAVSYSRKQATASAYLRRDARGYLVVLHNPTTDTQMLRIRISRMHARKRRLTLTLGAGAERRLPVPTPSRRAAPSFTVTAIVISGPQRGLRLRLTAPLSPQAE